MFSAHRRRPAGFWPAFRISTTAVALATATAMVTTLWGPAADAAPKPDDPLWKAKQEKSVPGKNFTPLPEPKDPAENKAIREAPKNLRWPASGTAEVAVPRATGAYTLLEQVPTPKARAGTLPIAVGPAQAMSARAAAPTTVRVGLSRRGSDGLLLQLSRTDGVNEPAPASLRLDYRAFRDRYGGDWALRLRLLKLPACALTRPGTPECAGIPVETQNNGSGTLTGDVTAGTKTEPALYAVQAAASSGTGDFGASKLSPTATWQVGGSSGDFSWNYPMAVPPSNGGPAPQLALGYTSGGVDGRTSSTNNQPSWVGQGFDLEPGGSIERRYASCASKTEKTGNNGTRITGDLCWATDNAMFTLNGKGGELVKDDATGKWHPRADDGSTIERLSGADNGDDGGTASEKGEYWVLTTKDGTKYYFGLNKVPSATEASNSSWTVPVFGNHSGEQCHATAFADSWCQQTYKWNLDYVVDRHGNTMSLYYDTEKNYYGRNATATAVTPYVRAGNIKRIEYGQRENALGTGRLGRVSFTTSERCMESTACATADYPDVPMDQRCINADGTAPAKCDNKFNPTFFTTKKLSKVTTELWRGSAYEPVSSWTLRYLFPDNGDGTKPGLWLEAVTNAGHVGNTGGVAIPEVNFDGIQLANRVDATGDNLPEMNWWRMSRIAYGTGGDLVVDYYPKDCGPGDVPAPDTNGRRCHPMKWTPPGGTTERTDWFHKYVVKSVTETDRVSGTEPVVTSLEYPRPPAWRHDDEDGLVEIGQKTWSQWRGYDVVIVRKGNGSGPQIVTENRYFRGMDGDQLASGGVKDVKVEDSTGGQVDDVLPLAGQPREVRTFNGSGVLVERTITDQWVSQPTATRVRSWGTTSSYDIEEKGNRQAETIAGGALRQSAANNVYDANGLLLKSNDQNDLSTTADDTCTYFEYTRNDSLKLQEMPKRELTVSAACDQPYTKDQVVSDERTYYDNATTLDAAPTKGDVTKTERLKGFGTDGTPQYQTVSTIKYDALGRSLEFTDALNHKSSTAYTPSGSGPVTKLVSTKANGQTTTVELEPAWGEEVAITDESGKRTEATYDPLGRTDKVWYPGRSGAVAGVRGANVAGRSAAGDNAAIPDVDYDYGILANAPSVVTTKSLQTDGSIETSYELYDGLLRPRQSQEAAQGGGRVVNDVIYDSRGLEVKENGPYYNDAPPVPDEVLIPNETELPTQKVTEYDLAGRPAKEIFKSENAVQWETTHSYAGDRETVDPPRGETPTTRITDVQGRLLELRQYTGESASGTYDSTKYTYEPDGQLKSMTDPAGNTWSYDYDERGRKVSESDPDKGTTTYTYDDLDQLLTKRDARGETLAYVYDNVGRATEVHEGSLQGRKLAEWVFDTILPGMPTSSTRYDANGNAYTNRITGYDAAGRATASEYVIPASEGALAGTYRFESTYRPDGQLDTEKLPGVGGLPVETLTYGYDEKDQPSTLASSDTTYVRGTTYTPFGEVEKVTLGATGGKWVELGYEYETGTRRLSRVVTQRETLPRRISDVAYAYDDSGNITKVTDAPSSTSTEQTDTQCFGYDYLRRMTSAWTPKPGTGNTAGDCTAAPTAAGLGGPAPYWNSWTFDKTGNRKTETKTWSGGSTTATYTYPAAGSAQPHSLRSVVTTGTGMPSGGRTDSYAYDETGDLETRNVAGTGETYTWHPEGDLSKVTKNGQETSYVYDANGERLIRRDPSGTTLYLGGTELTLKNGAVSGTRYYEHGDQTVAVRLATAGGTGGGTLTWLGADHHGTATTAIDNTAAQNVQRRRQDPYGNNRGTEPVAWPGQRGFVGGTSDPSTGLVHLGAREYDPATGRFISVDPQLEIDDPQTLNGYSYGNNNPITFSDPDGMSWFTSIVSSIKNVAQVVTNRVVETVKEAIHVVTPVVNWVRDRVTHTIEAIKSVVHKTVEVVKKVAKTVKKVIKKAIKTVRKVVRKVAQVAKKAVAKVKQVARAVGKAARAVAHKVAAVAKKAARWVYEHRAAILKVAAEIALTVAIGAVTGGVGALAVRGLIMGIRVAAAAKRAQAVARVAQVAVRAERSASAASKANSAAGNARTLVMRDSTNVFKGDLKGNLVQVGQRNVVEGNVRGNVVQIGTHNTINGNVSGAAVQARSVSGGIRIGGERVL
ncbi:RHS repeat domain-containing protein [Flindersiella endophytica]